MKMKKHLFGMSLALLIAGCGLLPGVGGQQVIGAFKGDWASVDKSKLRLALVGLATQGQFSYDNQLEIKDPNVTKLYALELPQVAEEGSYQVVAYSDDDANSRLSAGDAVLGDTCSKYLLYSQSNGNKVFWVGTLTTLSVNKGWNGYDSQTQGAPYQAENYTGFDLYLSGQCP